MPHSALDAAASLKLDTHGKALRINIDSRHSASELICKSEHCLVCKSALTVAFPLLMIAPTEGYIEPKPFVQAAEYSL